MSRCEVRALYDDQTITVYQAYNSEIADVALKAKRFLPPFSMSRMSWIKPSFNWMLYRSDFARKPNQDRILAIKISKVGFDWALENGVLSNFTPQIHKSKSDWNEQLQLRDVRVQWDPERDWRLQKMADVRTIQIGLKSVALRLFVNEWTLDIQDVTGEARKQAAAVAANLRPETLLLCDLERVYATSAKSKILLDASAQ